MVTLQRGKPHVWVLPVGEGDEPGLADLEKFLSAEEQSRAQRFAGENDNRQYRAAHILTRLMLSHFAPVQPAQWHFERGPHGRPELSEETRSTNLRFNLTHARNMVACAVTLQDDIGVDVEWVARSNQFAEIAEKKFSVPEIERFTRAPEEEKRRIFFSFWTLKEAYIKAIGKGLREPLDGFAIDLEPLAIRFLADNGDEEAWALDLFEAGPEHLCAVCAGVGHHRPSHIHRRVLTWVELTGLAG